MNGPSALALLQLDNGTSAWRVRWPMLELARRGYPIAYGSNTDPRVSSLIAQADVVILHRLAWLPEDRDKALAWRELLHHDGKALVFDCDDDIYSPACIARIRRTGDAELNARSDAQLEIERQARTFALQICDGVTVSTEPLAAVCRQYTDKPVIVVPNAIDLPRFRAGLDGWQRTIPGPTIGWAGGNRPDSDAEDLAIAWGRIAKRFPDVTFVVAYYPLPALVNAVPPERLRILPQQSLDTYARNLAEIDIGCCPLADEPFNRAKSPIKAMEFAAAGACVVASPTVYEPFLRACTAAIIAHDADEWELALAGLLKTPEIRTLAASCLLDSVEREHSLAGNVLAWPAAWAAIHESFLESRQPALVGLA